MHPTTPNIPITTLKPRASFPRPINSTSVSAVAETIVDPRNAKNFLHVASTVRSFISSVSAGRIDASGIFTTVYMNDKKI